MITTITTTTVTTVTAIAAMGLTAAVSIAAIVSLIVFLTTKEVAGASNTNTRLRVAKFVNVGIVPLVIVFSVIVIVKLLEVIS